MINESQKVLKSDSVKTVFEYKIQLGEFKEEVPNDIATIYLQLADKGINHFVNPKGLTIYTLGSYDEYKEAETQKNELINQYKLKDVIIIAFENDKQIPINEAIKR